MTNKEMAQGLMAVVMDRARSDKEREEALVALVAAKKAAKTSYEKLGVSGPMVERELKALEQRKAMGQPTGENFEMSQDELDAQKPRPKDEKDPLDEAPHVKTSSEHTIKLEEVDPKVAADVKKALKARDQAKPTKPTRHEDPEVRGKISEMSRKLLLETDDPYATICEAIKAKHPHAVTTPRSLASVASEMRAKGEKVPQRRKPAKSRE